MSLNNDFLESSFFSWKGASYGIMPNLAKFVPISVIIMLNLAKIMPIMKIIVQIPNDEKKLPS